jgi:hypothetical protein
LSQNKHRFELIIVSPPYHVTFVCILPDKGALAEKESALRIVRERRLPFVA